MGASQSRALAVINSTINDSISLYTEEVQSCNQAANNAVIINQVSTCGGTQEISGIDFDTSSIMNQSCMADFNASSDTTTQITEDMKQAAEAINTGLNIGLNSTDAKTITTLMTNLATTVNTSFSQAASNVTTNLLALSQFAGPNADNTCQTGDQIVRDVSFKAYTNQFQGAVEKSVAQSKIKDQLSQVISQTAQAKNEGLNLNFVAALVAVVVVVVVVFMYSGAQVAKGLITTPTGMVITLVIIYLLVAGTTGIFPFKRDKKSTGNDIALQCAKDRDCGSGFVCSRQICRLECSEDGDCVHKDDSVAMTCNNGACEPPQ